MCAEKSNDDVEQWVELTNFKDLEESPRYPRRRQLSEGSEPTPPSQFSADVAISMPNTPLPPIRTGSTTIDGAEAASTSETDINKSSKRRLKFSGEPLDLSGTEQRPSSEAGSSSSSSTHHGTSKSPKSPRGKFFGSHSPSLTTPLSRSSSRYRDADSRSQASDSRNRNVDIRTKGGQYSVAAKDASLLGRIAHKALKRNTRVLQPHEVFVELEELKSCGDDFFMEWEETARWIKFEEDVEQDAGRWGRPHVSALAFHSLVDLRKSLEVGCILLDVEGDNFPSIADKIVEQLQDMGQLPHNKVVFISQALYKRHRHQHHITLWDDLRKAAKSADGTLHHLGDHLRHRHHNSHPQDTHHLTEEEERQQQQHNAVNPLFAEESTTVNLKSVSFAVRGSDDSLQRKMEEAQEGDNRPLEGGNAKHSSASSLRGMSSREDNREEPAPLAIQRNASHPKLTSSMQDLLKKIPDDAESITVLVGGVDFLNEPVATFVRLEQSHLLGDLTEVPIPVRFIFLLLGPIQQMDYHEVGRAMATLMSDKCFHEIAYTATCKEDLLDAMDQFLDESIVLPPGDWDHELLLPLMHERNEIRRRREKKAEEAALAVLNIHDPMKCSRRPFGGLFADFKTLIQRYPSDIKDFFHTQCLLSILFTFISCIAPAITFGGLMEEVTHEAIGPSETLVGTGLCGMVYGLFAVQPLAILAFTGPLLLFEEIIIDFSETLNIEYLPWRACIGIWLMLFICVCAIGELSFLVRKFTRFSEEIFTGVVTLFFTYEACRTLIGIFMRNPICGINYPCGNFKNCSNTCNCSEVDPYYSGSGMDENDTPSILPTGFLICNQPNTSLWCLLLCFGTFFIAVMLRKLRQSRFLGKQGRRLVSDFGMLTAIATMVLLAYILKNRIPVERLVIPDGLKPSDPNQRNWLINPLYNLGAGEIIGAAIPAALLATLIFIENQLTLLKLNKPEHQLKKGVGYHLDLLLVALLAGVCGVFGLPWHCAATVRTIQHFQTLGVFSRKNAPGEKARLVNVYEQRVTNFMVHLFMFFSPFAYRVLREIPFAVVLGVFFYLAYASFSSIQLLKRIKLLLMPPKHHPDIHYVRKVKTWKMNMYTILQVLLIVTFYGLKLSPAGMMYPLAIVLLIPLRFLLGKYSFTHVEIEALDSEEDFPEDHHDKEADFAEYEVTHLPY